MAENELSELAKVSDERIGTAPGIAAVALTMAMKYHDINTVQEGALYQQYKLEGKNMRELQIDHVFETAIKIEVHLLGASERIARLVVDAIAGGTASEEEADEPASEEDDFPDSNAPPAAT